MSFSHKTVLLEETVAAIECRDGGLYADLTLGGGGHAEAILEACGPTGRLIGVDRDVDALKAAGERLARFGDRATLVQGTFGGFAQRAVREDWGFFDGVIADVGVSSHQIDTAERGFSFRREGPLDMRMDPSDGLSAKELIASLDDEGLANLIYEFGEERRSRPIARSIKRAEEEDALHTTADLARAVRRVFGGGHSRIDPATRTFQALRIAVNDELGELDRLLDQVPNVLADDGHLAVISFHSLEDRRVKWAFRNDARIAPKTKKPIVAGEDEKSVNSRSRTAKLRVGRRVAREPGQ